MSEPRADKLGALFLVTFFVKIYASYQMLKLGINYR